MLLSEAYHVSMEDSKYDHSQFNQYMICNLQTNNTPPKQNLLP